MPYKRKTKDEWQLHVKYGYHGWEHELSGTFGEIRHHRKEYRENCPEYPTRIVCKRVPIDTEESNANG